MPPKPLTFASMCCCQRAATVQGEHLESLGAECFMGQDQGHGKGFFEIKFRGPDGTVFDIAQHPWMGSKPHDA